MHFRLMKQTTEDDVFTSKIMLAVHKGLCLSSNDRTHVNAKGTLNKRKATTFLIRVRHFGDRRVPGVMI